MPPRRSPAKFREIEARGDGDEYNPSPSPAPPTPRKRAKSDRTVQDMHVFVKACERCQRGKRDCVVDELGAACAGCKARKYGCDNTGKMQARTMMVARPVTDSDSEVEVEVKKRRAESPVVARKKAKKVKVKEEKVEKKKARATGQKGKGNQRGLPKGSVVAVDTDEEEDEGMAVDDESDEGERQPKRARQMKGKYSKRNKI
jgi:hypothetical protein